MTQTGTRGTGFARWRVGSATVARIDETVQSWPISRLIPAATTEALAPYRGWFDPGHLSATDEMLLNFAGFVIDSSRGRILVDTCIGPEHAAGPGAESAFLENLCSAGYPPETIDAVVCTHAHFDHVGWNTVVDGGVRRPTFPRARYLFCDAEWESVRDGVEEGNGLLASVERDVRFVVAAGVADVVPGSHRLSDEVWLLSTPGHSPGHVCVVVESDGTRAIISGDAIHHPVQLTEPEWGTGPDVDPALAASSRAALVDLLADTDTLLIGSHFATPTAGYVRTTGGDVRFAGVPGTA